MKYACLCFIAGVLLVSGCIGPNASHVVNGNPRAAIAGGNVRTYTTRPEKAESIGMVRATVYGERQSSHDGAISMMKAEAAKIGANGIIVAAPTSGDGWSGTLSGTPIFYTGEAIFVP